MNESEANGAEGLEPYISARPRVTGSSALLLGECGSLFCAQEVELGDMDRDESCFNRRAGKGVVVAEGE